MPTPFPLRLAPLLPTLARPVLLFAQLAIGWLVQLGAFSALVAMAIVWADGFDDEQTALALTGWLVRADAPPLLPAPRRAATRADPLRARECAGSRDVQACSPPVCAPRPRVRLPLSPPRSQVAAFETLACFEPAAIALATLAQHLAVGVAGGD
jgi:hypothetical protein